MWARNTAVRLVNCTVARTFRPDTSFGVVVADPGATVWLQGTSVRGNQAVLPLLATTSNSDGDGSIYSDREETAFFWTDGGVLEQRSTGQPPPATAAFLSGQDEWFLDVLTVGSCMLLTLLVCHDMCGLQERCIS